MPRYTPPVNEPSVSPLALLRDRLVAADPGGGMARFALRATVAVAVAIAALAGVAALLGQPFMPFVIGMMVAMMATLLPRDPTPRGKIVTMLLLPVPAAISVTLAVLSSRSAVLAPAVFVVVMFAAVWIRRFGDRFMGFGMIAFMTYFFALYIGAVPAQLPWMYLSLVVGVACSLLVRFVVVRDRPLDLRRAMPAIRAQIRLILYDLGRIVQHRPSRRFHTRIGRRVMELNGVVLQLRAQGDAEARLALFDAELAVQRLDTLSGRERSAEEAEAILHDLRAIYHAPTTPEGRNIAWRTAADERFGSALRSLVEALDRPALHRAPASVPAASGEDDPAEAATDAPEAEDASATDDATAAEAGAPSEEAEGGTDDAEEEDGSDDREGGLLPTTRTAIQVAVAGALAIVGGQILVPGQWHWAVITSFVVFTGTSSRGDVFVRGWQRVVGTALGVVAGVGIATLVGDNRPLAVALIFLSVFAGFYLIRASYTLMIFWITVMIALLYRMLGMPSAEMLQIRAEETLLGAIIGIVIATVLLPTRTKPKVEREGRELLEALSDVLAACRRRLRGEEGDEALLERVRELDQHFQTLRQVGQPLAFRPPWSAPRASERWLAVLPLLLYEAHHLVHLSRERTADAALLEAAWPAATSRLQARIEPLAEAIASGRASSLSDATVRRAVRAPWPGEGPPSRYRVPAEAGPDVARLARSLSRVDWIVTVLAEGVAGATTPGTAAAAVASDPRPGGGPPRRA